MLMVLHWISLQFGKIQYRTYRLKPTNKTHNKSWHFWTITFLKNWKTSSTCRNTSPNSFISIVKTRFTHTKASGNILFTGLVCCIVYMVGISLLLFCLQCHFHHMTLCFTNYVNRISECPTILKIALILFPSHIFNF